ncbi:MAG TPA: aminoglycoside phosphotransferase family protein [Fimbriimonadaceae bacterium]|nr:aminoglycoside phosphotransferase family protein [Fimbriimonadaceae bacterium]
MSYPESLIRAIADRHGIAGAVSLLPKGGMVNEAWAIGDAHVLRIVGEGKDEVCDAECEREAAVVPLLVAAGLTTPALIACEMEFAPRPYTIYERVKGEVIGFSRLSYGEYESAWLQIGRDLALLHRLPVPEGLRRHLHQDKGPDYEKWIKRAVKRGVISQATADDILSSVERLSALGGDAWEPCFIHNDVHPWNLMGDPSTGRLTAILDWGDASYGDPARDFAMMPLPCVPSMFKGYYEAGQDINAIRAMAARAVVVGLSVALFEVSTPEMREFDQRWWRMSDGGWEGMKKRVSELWPGLL